MMELIVKFWSDVNAIFSGIAGINNCVNGDIFHC